MAPKHTIGIFDETGTLYQNLWGVFRREFPVVFQHAERSGEWHGVEYAGRRFFIKPVGPDFVPLPLPPSTMDQRDNLRAALQWLLDDMHDAGETHDAGGTVFDSVASAAEALIAAGGKLSWFPQDGERTRPLM